MRLRGCHTHSSEGTQDREKKEKEKDPEDVGILDPVVLSDADLKAALFERGVKAGPIVASTRAVYENKLRKLLQADGQEVENGLEEGVLYSDSEEEKEEGPVGAEKEQPIEQQDQTEEEIRENDGFVYPQCFLLSSRLRACTPRDKETCPKENSGNILKLSEQTSSHCSRIPAGISRTSSLDHRSGLGSGVGRFYLTSLLVFKCFAFFFSPPLSTNGIIVWHTDGSDWLYRYITHICAAINLTILPILAGSIWITISYG
ncbi:LEM domain-containing protein 1 isoform X2 [Antennarius striatus]|uniref:LEM domain-containing protein 1 isoform X2 n=1 Tax=Antennarius striatus TaxID=241820 RepID=UPI0035ADDEEB